MIKTAELSSQDKKRKNKLKRTIKALGDGFCILSVIFILWVGVSWIDVVTHNMELNGIQSMLSWNFFLVCFQKHQVNHTILLTIAITVFIALQIFMRNGRLKRMCGLELMIIISVLALFVGSWFTWLFIAGALLSIWREIGIIIRVN